MSVETDECNCGPDPVCINDDPIETEVDEENLLKMLEEQNK